MASCLGAQHALRRVAGVETDLARLARRLELLAQALNIDLDRLEHVDRVERRGGVAVTWAEAEAVGLHDTAAGS